MFWQLPSSSEEFLGRQLEMYYLIKALMNQWLVTIIGPAGIGKTTIAKGLANYIIDREIMFDGVIFITLKNCLDSMMII